MILFDFNKGSDLSSWTVLDDVVILIFNKKAEHFSLEIDKITME